jgi:hypothetical protein
MRCIIELILDPLNAIIGSKNCMGMEECHDAHPDRVISHSPYLGTHRLDVVTEAQQLTQRQGILANFQSIPSE